MIVLYCDLEMPTLPVLFPNEKSENLGSVGKVLAKTEIEKVDILANAMTLKQFEKQISDQGFDCKRAEKEDIKRFLSKYFGHMVEDGIDDVDGERIIKKWMIPD